MKSTKLFLSLALVVFTTVNALEKPEGASINPETATLKQEVDSIKAEGTLGPKATEARRLETQRLSQRYLKLALKADKSEAEKKEFEQIGAELKTRIGAAIEKLLPAK